MIKNKNFLLYLMCGYVFLEIMLNTNFIIVIPKTVINIFRFFFLFLMLIYACVIILNNNRWLMYAIFAIIAFLTVLFAKTTFVLVLFIMFVLSSQFGHEQIVKYLNDALLCVLFLTVISSVVGLIPSATSIRQGVNRQSLGFGSCTMPQSLFMFVSLNFLYLKHRNTKFWLLIFEFIVASVFYFYTQARTGYFLTLIIIIVNLILKLNIKFSFLERLCSRKFFIIFMTCIPLIFLSLSVFMTYLYAIENSFALKINNMLSARLVFQRDAFINHTLTLFGDKIVWINSSGDYCGVDNSYLFYLFNYGLINTILLYSIVSINIYKSLKNKNYLLFFILLMICVNAIVEPYLVDFKYNYFMFYIVSKSSVFVINNRHKKNILMAQIN